MIARALVIPTEHAPSILDIKRALLTYDQVHLFDPDDRDLIPSHHYDSAYSMNNIPAIIGHASPVRPLGKFEDYNTSFESLLDAAREARIQGQLLTLPYTPARTENGIIGFNIFAIAGMPSHYGLRVMLYRHLAQHPDVLSAVLPDRLNNILPQPDSAMWDSLAPTGRDDEDHTFVINDQPYVFVPPSASISIGNNIPDDVITRLALNRLGALTRTLSKASELGMMPLTSDSGMERLLDLVRSRAGTVVLGAVATQEADWEVLQRVERVHRVVISDLISNEVLHARSIPDILRMRTIAWGKEKENRYKFVNDVADIALSAKDDREFQQKCQTAIERYQRENSDFFEQLYKVGIGISLKLVASAVTLGQAGAITERLTGLPYNSMMYLAGLATTAVAASWNDMHDIYRSYPNKSYPGYAIGQVYNPFLKT